MPKMNEQIVTLNWMLGIIKGEYWCLASDEVNSLKQCVKPPSRKVLARILVDKMRTVVAAADMVRKLKATAILIENHPPDVNWMLTCLSQIDPNNDLFRKDYVLPKVDRAGLNVDIKVEDLQGFF